jgi:hypothetical protein
MGKTNRASMLVEAACAITPSQLDQNAPKRVQTANIHDPNGSKRVQNGSVNANQTSDATDYQGRAVSTSSQKSRLCSAKKAHKNVHTTGDVVHMCAEDELKLHKNDDSAAPGRMEGKIGSCLWRNMEKKTLSDADRTEQRRIRRELRRAFLRLSGLNARAGVTGVSLLFFLFSFECVFWRWCNRSFFCGFLFVCISGFG